MRLLKLLPSLSPAGFLALVLSAAAVAAAAYLGADFTYVHSHFLQLAVASFMLSALLSVYLYVRSLRAAPEELALGGRSGETPQAAAGAWPRAMSPHDGAALSSGSLQDTWHMTSSKDVSSIPD